MLRAPKLIVSGFVFCLFASEVYAADCALIFGTLGIGKSAQTSSLWTPDEQVYVWSEGTLQATPSVLHTTLFLFDNNKAQREVVFRSDRTPDGHLRNFRGPFVLGSYDAFCAIDWSADSRFLLVEHTRGLQGSDSLNINTWVFDRITKTQRRTNLNELLNAVEQYAKKRQYKSSLYYVSPIGWESAGLHRIVLSAAPGPGEVEDFGIWSTEINGKNPRLLAENSGKYVPNHFGKTRDISSSPRHTAP